MFQYCKTFGQTLLPIWKSSYRQRVLQWNRFASVLVKVPALGGETVKDGQVFFVKKSGESVQKDDVVANIETEKINVPVLSPSAGVIERFVAEDASTVQIGDELFYINDEVSEATRMDNKEEKPAESPQEPKKDEEKKKMEIDSVKSVHVEEAKLPKDEEKMGSIDAERPETRERMSRMRGNISKRLKESQSTTVSVSTFNEVDMSGVIKMRNTFQQEFQDRYGVKLGFMSTFVTATVRALLEFPEINAVIEGDDIVYRHYVDMGIAVSTDKGLVVPVIRNAELLSYPAIEKAIFDLAKKARSRLLTSEDLEGGTFTVTNTGIHGGLFGTPILNLGQSGILGIYGVKDRPVVVDGKVVIRPITFTSLTYDHRLIDGEQAARFLAKVKLLIEDPARNLLRL